MYGQALKIIRKYYRMNQAEFGTHLGLKTQMICFLEQGKRPIQLHTLQACANWLDVPLSQLIAFAEFIEGQLTVLDNEKLECILDWAEEVHA